MKLPTVRSLSLNAAQFGTGALAAIAFMSSHSVDLYAAWDQFSRGLQLIFSAWAIVGPILIGASVAYYSTTRSKIKDIVNDAGVTGVVSPENADLSSPKVQASAAALPK